MRALQALSSSALDQTLRPVTRSISTSFFGRVRCHKLRCQPSHSQIPFHFQLSVRLTKPRQRRPIQWEMICTLGRTIKLDPKTIGHLLAGMLRHRTEGRTLAIPPLSVEKLTHLSDDHQYQYYRSENRAVNAASGSESELVHTMALRLPRESKTAMCQKDGEPPVDESVPNTWSVKSDQLT